MTDRARQLLEELAALNARLAALPVDHSGSYLARALEERDRQIAALQHEADERLATLNAVVADAEMRLGLLGSLTAQYETMQARLIEVETQLVAQANELQALRGQNEVLAEAAEARLQALEVNAAAVAALQVELAKYQ